MVNSEAQKRRGKRAKALWPTPVHLGVAVAVASVLFAIAVGVLWKTVGVGQAEAPDPGVTGTPVTPVVGTSELVQLQIVKVGLTVVAGAGGLIALVVAYRRQRVGEAAEERENSRLFTERFTAASAPWPRECRGASCWGLRAGGIG